MYDTGALIAAERNGRAFVAQHGTLLVARVRPLVPAGVQARAWDTCPAAAVEHLDAPILTDDLGDIGKLVEASGHSRIKVARP